MSDLTDELRQVAADAASQARPMATADVIRRGNRRRHRTIAQRSLGGLSVAGIGAAVLLTGAASSPVTPASASAGKGVITLTESTTSSGATLSVRIAYRREPHGKLKVLSFGFSGHARIKSPKSSLFLTFSSITPHRRSGARFGLTEPEGSKSGDFSGALSARTTGRLLKLTGTQLTIEVGSAGQRQSKGWQPVRQILREALVLQ